MTQPIHTIAEEEPVPNWLKKAPPGYRWQYRFVASPDCLASWKLVPIDPTTPPPAGEKAPASQVTTSKGPSKEAMDAAKETRASVVGLNDATTRKAAEIIDRHFQSLRNSEFLYRKEMEAAVAACAFMHDDKSLNLRLGSRITVDGIIALKEQRDALRAKRDTLAQQLDEAIKAHGLVWNAVRRAASVFRWLGYPSKESAAFSEDVERVFAAEKVKPRWSIDWAIVSKTDLANLTAAQSRIAELEKEVEGFKANNRYHRGHTYGYNEATADAKARIAELEAQLSAKKDLGNDADRDGEPSASELPRGVSIILYRNGYFAVSRRIGKNGHEGLHQFAGGHVEKRETPLCGAHRELFEETGLNVDKDRFVFLGETGPLKGYKGESYIGVRYALVLTADEKLQCTEPLKATPWQWVSASKMLSLEMLQQTQNYAYAFHQGYTTNPSQQPGADKVSDVVNPPPNPPPSDQQGPSAEEMLEWLNKNGRKVKLATGYRGESDEWSFQHPTEGFISFKSLHAAIQAAMKERTP